MLLELAGTISDIWKLMVSLSYAIDSLLKTATADSIMDGCKAARAN